MLDLGFFLILFLVDLVIFLFILMIGRARNNLRRIFITSFISAAVSAFLSTIAIFVISTYAINSGRRIYSPNGIELAFIFLFFPLIFVIISNFYLNRNKK